MDVDDLTEHSDPIVTPEDVRKIVIVNHIESPAMRNEVDGVPTVGADLNSENLHGLVHRTKMPNLGDRLV